MVARGEPLPEVVAGGNRRRRTRAKPQLTKPSLRRFLADRLLQALHQPAAGIPSNTRITFADVSDRRMPGLASKSNAFRDSDKRPGQFIDRHRVASRPTNSKYRVENLADHILLLPATICSNMAEKDALLRDSSSISSASNGKLLRALLWSIQAPSSSSIARDFLASRVSICSAARRCCASFRRQAVQGTAPPCCGNAQ